MVTFKNNNRRNNFKRNDRSFKKNGPDRNKFSSNFANNDNFIRKSPGRNNHNAAKLIEKISRGVIKITQRGKDLLDTNIVEITEEDLMQFEEFRVFKSLVLEKIN